VDKIDHHATYINSITGISLEKAAIPMFVEDDRRAIEIALGSIGLTSPNDSKIVRIKNTLDLETVEVSEAFAEELQKRSDLEILDGPSPIVFTDDGNLQTL
jgi:hypothetical protein